MVLKWNRIKAARGSAVKYFSSSSSSSSHKEKIMNSSNVNAYAKKHEAFCRQGLMIPPAPSLYAMDESDRCNTMKNLFNYLSWRKWESQYLYNPYSYAMISHALTYPLTLASHAIRFQSEMKQHLTNREESDVIRLCCVGARSEAYLPDHYWREFLYFCNIHSSVAKPSKWHIDFIGYDLPPNMKSRDIFSSDVCTDTTTLGTGAVQTQERSILSSSSLHMTFTSGLLHKHVRELYKMKSVQEILSQWDGFVLFNPGIGHSNLESSWDPTLQFIFKTDKRVLFTAHSELDGQRDGQILQKYVGKSVSHVHNPFSSLMAYEDPFPPEDGVPHQVRPNHSVLLM